LREVTASLPKIERRCVATVARLAPNQHHAASPRLRGLGQNGPNSGEFRIPAV